MDEIKVTIGREKYRTEVHINQHNLIADEPIEVGGTDLGPNPTSILLSALGTCKAMTMRMYADQKQWPLDAVEIILSSEVVKSTQQQTTYIRCTVKLFGDLDEVQKERIFKVGDKCPVQKILSNPVVIESNMLQ
ncbi:OsmC family protein [Sphingobacterium faecale]|nr:OsmC family protein [Sphingobacterium faecale]